ncbi:hypothetical protein BGZ76_008797 [Entomortierella beljakovae]|nr:hypothetical protein BGZ76_008797 [Entomortierella beljakovae]
MASFIPMMEDRNIERTYTSDLERVDSSAISVLSASGTLVTSDTRLYSTPRFPPQPPYPLSRSCTLDTLAIVQQRIPQPFDPQHFKSIINDLNEYLEQFEKLNDQILDDMTRYDESSRDEHSDRRPERTVDLESERRTTAKAIADLILSSWPILCNSINEKPMTPSSSLNKQRTKAAIQLKQIITSFWSSQSLFQEKAQLVLDILQDPSELENEDRIRILRSRHLNNLLSNLRSPMEGVTLAHKFKMDQEQIGQSTEALQCVWLDIILKLEPSCLGTAGETRPKSDGSTESFGRKFLRIGKNKKQALKSLIKNMA